jgi:hypothetical protein
VLLLTSTSDALSVVTGQAVAVDVHASWMDYATGTVTPGRTNTAISTAATTTVVAAPAASTQRNCKSLHLRNKDAALSVDVTVRHTDGTTIVELIKITLAAGDSLEYIEGVGFFKIPNPVNAPLPTVSNADQLVGASVTNYLTGSDIHITAGRPLRVGTVMRWHITCTKTAAGTVSMSFDVRVGTAGTTADTSRATLATGTQTGIVDNGELEIGLTVRSISASGIITTTMQFEHNAAAATGLAITQVVTSATTSAAFDTTATNLIFGVSLTTGALHAITITRVVAEVLDGTI